MDQSFILQFVHACPGYQRFFYAWCRINGPENCPTEAEWERFDEREPERKNPSLSELLDTFPGAVKLAKTKLRELREEEPLLKERCISDLTTILASLKTNDPILMDFANDVAFYPMELHEKEVEKWEKIVKMDEFRRKPAGDDTITDADILRAKEFPIVSIHKPNAAGFIHCPFYNEKTPSCKVYKDNRFHCFGCGSNGDVIDLVMKENNLTFIDAVKRVLNR